MVPEQFDHEQSDHEQADHEQADHEHDAGELTRLVRFMTRSGRRFGLALATYASAAVAADARARASERCRDSGVRVGTVGFAELAGDVIGNLATKSHSLDVLFVIGIDPIAYDAEQQSVETRTMLSLNMRRDELPARVDVRIVFWLVSEGYPQMAILAWDLLMVANTRFEFREQREMAAEPRAPTPTRPSWLVPIGEVDPAILADQAERLVAAAQAATDEDARADAAASAGRLLASIGRFEEARRWLAIAAEGYEQLGIRTAEPAFIFVAAVQRRRIAQVARLNGDIDLALESARKSEALLAGMAGRLESRAAGEWARTVSLVAALSVAALSVDHAIPEADDTLLEKWANGDLNAGSALLHRYHGPISAYFEIRTSDAEDLTQETFAAVAQHLLAFRHVRDVRAALFRIARIRYYLSTPSQPIFDDLLAFEKFAAEESDIPIEKWEILLGAIQEISIDDMDLIELRYREAMSLADMARLFKIPEATVRIQIDAARGRLIQAARDRAAHVGENEIERMLEALRNRRLPSSGSSS